MCHGKSPSIHLKAQGMPSSCQLRKMLTVDPPLITIFSTEAKTTGGPSACLQGFPGNSVVKNPPASAGNLGSIPGSGRSPGERSGYPLQYSCLGNPMDRGAWWAIVHGVRKSQKNLPGPPYKPRYMPGMPFFLVSTNIDSFDSVAPENLSHFPFSNLIKQRLVNFSSKGPDNEYFRLLRIYTT